MKATNANGIVIKDGKLSIKTLSIRAEKTNDFITVSLADDVGDVMIQVNYKDIKKVVEAL